MEVSIDSQELSEYLKALTEGIEKGLENSDFKIHHSDTILVELAIVNSKKAKGGLKIFVAKAEGQYNKEEISKIKIPIRRKSSAAIGFVPR